VFETGGLETCSDEDFLHSEPRHNVVDFKAGRHCDEAHR